MSNVRQWFLAIRLSICSICIALLLGGCVTHLIYHTAIPSEPAGFVEAEIHRNTIEVTLRDLTLRVQVHAARWRKPYDELPLGVWIDIEPIGESVTLDARYVLLQSDQSGPMTASSYLGPATSWFDRREYRAGCGPRTNQLGEGLTSYPIPIPEKHCFMFWYDTDSGPDHDFVLSIDGLAIDGEKIEVPKLHFEAGTITKPGGV